MQVVKNEPKAELNSVIIINGKEIVKNYSNGTWWIAVKPICELLNIEHTRQFKTLKEHRILSRVWAVQPMHDTTNRKQEMLCLPQKYITGWLFSIQSSSEELIAFQEECFDVLYDYFFGASSQQDSFLKESALLDLEIEAAKRELASSQLAEKLNQLMERKKMIGKLKKAKEKERITNQLPIWMIEKENDSQNIDQLPSE